MQSFKYQPLLGLFNIDKVEIESANVLSTLNFVEERVNSSPKGRAKDLTLFLYLIDVLANANLSFYVKGGTIMQYYLGDHARPSLDVDMVIPKDVDNFIKKAQEILDNHQGKFTFKVTHKHVNDANEKYFYDSFDLFIDAYENGVKVKQILLEGVYGDIFNDIEPVTYKLPSFIHENGTFLGVPIEFVFAEKVLAITSELKRPYKHLIDAYSLSNIDINIERLKKYADMILFYENINRRKFGLPEVHEYGQIKPEKEFTHSYFFESIQAGYLIKEEEMIQKVSTYLNKLK